MKKVDMAIDAAVRWCGGDADKAIDIVLAQAELDPALDTQLREEAIASRSDEIFDELVAEGFTSDNVDEWSEKVFARLILHYATCVFLLEPKECPEAAAPFPELSTVPTTAA